MSEKLKPCPFCGSEAEHSNRRESSSCTNPDCFLSKHWIPDNKWSTRHDSEEIERLRKGLEDILYKSVNCDIYDLKGIAEKALSKQESHNATL